MTVTIGRRELLAAVGGAAVAWQLAARAQQPAMPGISVLDRQSLSRIASRRAEGTNVGIEYRWATTIGCVRWPTIRLVHGQREAQRCWSPC